MVWLSIIPLISVIWTFFVVMALAKSIGNEFQLRGIPFPDPLPGQSIGMAMCICSCLLASSQSSAFLPAQPP